jgi:hypothetical protein
MVVPMWYLMALCIVGYRIGVKDQIGTCIVSRPVLSSTNWLGCDMTKQEILQVKLRMPKAAYRRIQREAERRGQTINAEILRRLEESYQLKLQDDIARTVESSVMKAAAKYFEVAEVMLRRSERLSTPTKDKDNDETLIR